MRKVCAMSAASDALAAMQANLPNAGMTIRHADRTVTYPPLDQMMTAIARLQLQVDAEQRRAANQSDVGPRALLSDFNNGRGVSNYGRLYTD